MIARLLAWMSGLCGMHRLWLPVVRYRAPFPADRPGKSGVPAARRTARKRRHLRRARR
ncbi:MAG: hypothetical protein NDI93_01970 [Pseudomonas sp.]|nr:hypothetical protein [Pseudomonas sp.]